MATNQRQSGVPGRELRQGFTTSNADTLQALASAATTSRAAQLLPQLNTEDIPAMVRYIRSASKHPLAETSFVERYLETAGRIIEGARVLLEGGHSLTSLQQFRTVLVKDLPPLASTVVPPRPEWSGIQESYERNIQTLLSGLASEPEDHPELKLRALNLAIIALKVQTRKEEFDRLMKGEGRARLTKYKDLMDKAYKSAAQRHGENFCIEDRLAAFVELSLDRTGRLPQLRILNDFDGNLTQVPESGSPWKPGEPTNGLLNTLDKAARLPMFIRLVTTELPGLDMSMRQSAATLYTIAAHQAHLYEDVQDLFLNTASMQGVQHSVLTANHAGLIEAKLQAIGRSNDVHVLAVGQLDWYENKVDRLLLEIMREDDVNIYLFADDNDGPVARHLEVTEPVLPKQSGVKDAIYFHDLIFLASRHSTGHPTRVGDMLVKKRIDHIDLCREPTATGFKGFGRMQKFIERYHNAVTAGKTGVEEVKPIG